MNTNFHTESRMREKLHVRFDEGAGVPDNKGRR